MPRKLRLALSPGWLALHLVTVALLVTMVLLGRWQLLVSESKHFNLRNFGYALQWWAFAGFVVFMWVRLLRDALRRDAESAGSADAEPVAQPQPTVEYRRYRAPQSSDGPAPAADPLHAEYNDYLARLAKSADPGAERTTP